MEVYDTIQVEIYQNYFPMNLHCCGKVGERDSSVSVVIHPSQGDVNKILKYSSAFLQKSPPI